MIALAEAAANAFRLGSVNECALRPALEFRVIEKISQEPAHLPRRLRGADSYSYQGDWQNLFEVVLVNS